MKKGLFYAILASVLWAIVNPFIKQGLSYDFSPMNFAGMIGTMVLVLMGCGSAVFAGSMAGTVGAGVGTVGVALAFGLSVVAMAYAIGGISGWG
jgi:glycerol uptake facilitator-like aquaporin